MNPETKSGKGEQKEKFVDPNVRDVQETLQRALGLRVHVEDRKGRGKVIIEYAKIEEFDRLLEMLGAKG